MKLVRMIFLTECIVIIILSLDILEVYTKLRGKDYAQLIYNVHNLYGTSSVLIIHNDELENARGIAPIFDTVYWLSSQRIPSLTEHIAHLSGLQSYYTKRAKRQLYVVFLRTYETMKQFEHMMQNVTVSEPAWLIIFRPYKGKDLLIDYCQNPKDNSFNLAFNTEMLIKCYDHEVLREWYSMHGNETTVSDLATWTPDHGLQLLTDKSTYLRRSHVGGINLRVVAVNGSSVFEEQSGKMGGYFGELVEELSHSINFSIKQIRKEIEYGIWNNNTKEWSGIMKQLHEKNADFSAADMTMSSRRLDDVDFSIPLITSRVVLCFRINNTTIVQQLGYFQTFNKQIWGCILALIVMTSMFLTIIKVKTMQSSDLKVLLCENYLNVWRIFCQQGLTEFPRIMSLRLVYFSIFISALIISSAYSASLISSLTVPSTVFPFTSLRGFVRDGSYKLIVLKKSIHFETFQETNDPLLKEMSKLMVDENKLPATERQALVQVCNSNAAFYATEDTIVSQPRPPNCKLAFIQTGDINCLSMPLSKSNQYAGIINLHLSRFLDNGMLQRLRNKGIRNYALHLKPKYYDVTFSNIEPILKIVIVGAFLSVLLLIAESIYFFLFNGKIR